MNKSRIIPQMISEITTKNQVTLFNKGERVSNFISIKYLTKLLDHSLKSSNTKQNKTCDYLSVSLT